MASKFEEAAAAHVAAAKSLERVAAENEHLRHTSHLNDGQQKQTTEQRLKEESDWQKLEEIQKSLEQVAAQAEQLQEVLQ
mmetsp:Transcript_79591/g.146349  ORF Transcript_79591/g.146349 Transcript_79591/m.146349 type:complete len:80 (+) Transcript_79591:132-371(+)